MYKLLVTVTVASLISGCVSVENPANWRPYDSGVNGKYYDCLREAQQGYATGSAGVAVSRYGGGGSASSSAGVKTNLHMLKSCMTAGGYQRREATTTEIVVGAVLSPIWLPLCFIATIGGSECFENF